MILVISSGLNYAFPATVNLIAMFAVVVTTVAGFLVVCIYTSQDFQLKVAKLLTLAFAIVMTITTVGLMAQVRYISLSYINCLMQALAICASEKAHFVFVSITLAFLAF